MDTLGNTELGINALKRKLGYHLLLERWQNLTQVVWAYVEKPVVVLVKRVDQRKGSPITRDREKSRKIIGETIKRDLDFNDLNVNIVYDKILQYRLIHIIDFTKWDKN